MAPGLTVLPSIDRLIRPRSVAIVGASADPTKTAGRPLRYLKRHGFAGHIYPINPRYADLDGTRCYPDVGSLPEVPDAAIILVGAERAESYVRDLSARGEQVARETAQEMTRIADSMQDSARLISSLSQHSQNISGIVKVIKDILGDKVEKVDF